MTPFPIRMTRPRTQRIVAPPSPFALEMARKRRRVRVRSQKIMAELARERRRLPDAGG